MSTEANKQVIVKFLEDVFVQRNLAAIPMYLRPESFLAGSLENLIRGISTSFPDYEITVEELIAEADKVVARLTMRGTHTGVFVGYPPTGKSIEVGAIHIYTLRDGRIVSLAFEFNQLMLYQQLGLTPVIEPTPDA